MAIPARVAVAGARRGCAGAAAGGVVGAGLGWVVPCGGLAGVAGACALDVMTLKIMKLSKKGVRMMHIIYGSRQV
jgi:hypothetical protein